MDDRFERRSVFSHEERAIARLRREGRDTEEIASIRDDSIEAVEKAIDRIRTKTDRALATLLQSSALETAVADLEPDARAELASALEERE